MHEILLSGYFREELQQRIWGRGSVPERPHRVLLSYSFTERWCAGQGSPEKTEPMEDIYIYTYMKGNFGLHDWEG